MMMQMYEYLGLNSAVSGYIAKYCTILASNKSFMKSKTTQFVVQLLKTCITSKWLLIQWLQSSFYSQLLKEVENSHLNKAISIDTG